MIHHFFYGFSRMLPAIEGIVFAAFVVAFYAAKTNPGSMLF